MNDHHSTSYPIWNELSLQMAQSHQLKHADLRQILHCLSIGDDLQTLYEMTHTPIADASVLVVLTNESQPKLLLTKRSSHITAHAGEVSFAGGKYESTDSNNVITALRESMEEIALDPNKVKLLGQLPVQISKAGLHVRPIVAVIEPNQALQAEQGEIERMFWADWAYLLNTPVTDYYLTAQVDGQAVTVVTPCWQIDGETVWGLTGRVIASLLKIGFNKDIEWYYKQI